MDRIPILKLGDALLVTIQVDMHDRLATALEQDLTDKIVTLGAKGVLIDISALEIVDSFIGRMLDNIAAVSRILDADTVVVGMRPSVAITLVELGLSLSGVKTALNVERGMAFLQRRLEEAGVDREDAGAGEDDWQPAGADVGRHRPGASGSQAAGGGSGTWSGRPDENRDGGERARPQSAGSCRRRRGAGGGHQRPRQARCPVDVRGSRSRDQRPRKGVN